MGAFSVSIETGTPSEITSDKTRREPRSLLFKRDANGAAVGARGFRADIENVCPLGGQAAGMRQCRPRIEEAAAVGK